MICQTKYKGQELAVNLSTFKAAFTILIISSTIYKRTRMFRRCYHSILSRMPIRKVSPINAVATQESLNMYTLMKIPHMIGSCLGLIPACGVTSNSPKDLHFRWFSLKMVYTFFCFCISCFLLMCYILTFFEATRRMYIACNNHLQMTICFYQINIFVVGIMQYLIQVLILVGFVVLSCGLRKVILAWVEMDTVMNRNYGYPQGLDKKFKIFSIIYIIYATGKTIVSQFNI